MKNKGTIIETGHFNKNIENHNEYSYLNYELTAV